MFEGGRERLRDCRIVSHDSQLHELGPDAVRALVTLVNLEKSI